MIQLKIGNFFSFFDFYLYFFLKHKKLCIKYDILKEKKIKLVQTYFDDFLNSLKNDLIYFNILNYLNIKLNLMILKIYFNNKK